MVIFGSGMVGYEALCFFGDENVECFCDNNLQLAGTKRYGKRVVPFEKVKSDYKDSIIIIAVLNYYDAYNMARQCEENGVYDYLFFRFPENIFTQKEYALGMVENPMKRMEMRREIYLKRIEELEQQVRYFVHYADIRHMKPAEGILRTWQLDTVKAAAELFHKISKLDIKPILYGGNLLGYVRHNGFIPWDDDIDFALIRDEYERLKKYCKEYLPSGEEFQIKQSLGETWHCSEQEMNGYYWVEFSDVFKIVKYRPGKRNMEVDFFSLDYYSDNYSFEELKEFVGKVREKLILARSLEEKIRCMEIARMGNKENTPHESSHIYFGIDNMDMMVNYQRGKWIPKDVVFPLRKVLYEGENFWVPNNPEELAGYEYDNVWEFPYDVGLQRHYKFDGED